MHSARNGGAVDATLSPAQAGINKTSNSARSHAAEATCATLPLGEAEQRAAYLHRRDLKTQGRAGQATTFTQDATAAQSCRLGMCIKCRGKDANSTDSLRVEAVRCLVCHTAGMSGLRQHHPGAC